MLSVFLISWSTNLRMQSLILILNLIMIVALILTRSSSLLTIHRLARILGRTMNCSLYGPKQGPRCFPPPFCCLGPGEHPTVASRNIMDSPQHFIGYRSKGGAESAKVWSLWNMSNRLG